MLLGTVAGQGFAPVIVSARLRKGSASSRGAATLVGDALTRVAATGLAGRPALLRADSAFYSLKVVARALRAGADVSITAKMNKAVVATIAEIPEDAWTAIKHPKAVYDEQDQRWVSDAEVAEIPYAAFTSKAKALHARLAWSSGGSPGSTPASGTAARRASCSPPTGTTRCSPPWTPWSARPSKSIVCTGTT